MSSESNHLAIYLIVGLNAACQMMLIWRLKLTTRGKLKYCALSVAIPAVVMMTMRLLVAVGAMHLRVADQGGIERAITTLAGMLLIAGPPLATAAAIFFSRKQQPVSEAGLLEA